MLLDALTDRAAPPPPGLRAVALAWERGSLNGALLDIVRSPASPDRAEAAAHLLKDTLDEPAVPAALEIAKSARRPGAVRRWLAEGLARLAAGRIVGWPDLGELVEGLATDPDPAARGGAVGLLMSLPPTPRSGRILLEMLEDQDAEVLSGALRALDGDRELAGRIEPAQLRMLRDHPHPLVRSGAEVLAALRKDSG